MEENNDRFEFLEQFGTLILDYSSQYGSPNGRSYVASNLAGPPSRYPLYGDFPETYVPRTYGKWWELSPCAPEKIGISHSKILEAQDFVDIYFREPVYPFCISIYETYNPGCVLRLWAGNGSGQWKVIYERTDFKRGCRATVFAPQIHTVNFLTSVVRVELDSREADYYPELDAVLLIGTLTNLDLNEPCLGIRGLCNQISLMGLHILNADDDVLANIKNIPSEIKKFLEGSPVESGCRGSAADSYSLDQLPQELLREIFKYLDLESLCSVARVCKTFYAASKDPFLFTELNLKTFWSRVNRHTLDWLAQRSRLLQKLDLSWTGSYGALSTVNFCSFIAASGSRLRILRLDNCHFVNNEALYRLSVSCPVLQELSLKGCRNLIPCAFWHIYRLVHLERLNLEETRIELPSLLTILKSVKSLKYLSLGSCISLLQEGSADEIVHWLSKYQPSLKMLDLWRHSVLSPQGMAALSTLTHLEELELGWCGLPSNGGWIAQLARNCRQLRKLFLTAVRVVTDRDLFVIADCCKQMEQLDILGNSLASPEGCAKILQECPKMKLLDVSYCSQIEDYHVEQWRILFPGVSVKRSSMPSD